MSTSISLALEGIDLIASRFVLVHTESGPHRRELEDKSIGIAEINALEVGPILYLGNANPAIHQVLAPAL